MGTAVGRGWPTAVVFVRKCQVHKGWVGVQPWAPSVCPLCPGSGGLQVSLHGQGGGRHRTRRRTTWTLGWMTMTTRTRMTRRQRRTAGAEVPIPRPQGAGTCPSFSTSVGPAEQQTWCWAGRMQRGQAMAPAGEGVLTPSTPLTSHPDHDPRLPPRAGSLRKEQW